MFLLVCYWCLLGISPRLHYLSSNFAVATCRWSLINGERGVYWLRWTGHAGQACSFWQCLPIITTTRCPALCPAALSCTTSPALRHHTSPALSRHALAQFSAATLFLPMAVDRDDGPRTPAVPKGMFQGGKTVVRLCPGTQTRDGRRSSTDHSEAGLQPEDCPCSAADLQPGDTVVVSPPRAGCRTEVSAAPASAPAQPPEEPISLCLAVSLMVSLHAPQQIANLV